MQLRIAIGSRNGLQWKRKAESEKAKNEMRGFKMDRKSLVRHEHADQSDQKSKLIK